MSDDLIYDGQPFFDLNGVNTDTDLDEDSLWFAIEKLKRDIVCTCPMVYEEQHWLVPPELFDFTKQQIVEGNLPRSPGGNWRSPTRHKEGCPALEMGGKVEA